jgi:hypothetical protein
MEVTTVTGGPEPDADGYSISIDEGAEMAIATDATMRLDDVDPGDHAVQLGGLAANCTIAGQNPLTISVAAGETARVDFQLTCSATTGSLQVTASTTGGSPDPDGYSVTFDGSDRGSLGVSGSLTLKGLTAGSHVVGLSGVAANCSVAGENPHTVSVTPGASALAAFAVICSEAPPNTGSLRITTLTSGPEPDPDGYAFALDAGTRQPIGVSGTVTLAAIASGVHRVHLSSVAANCSIQGGSPVTVTVTSGAVADVSFAIACVATGTLRVTTTTTGSTPDLDGYTVKVDAGAAQPTGSNSSLSVNNLIPGAHSVAVGGLATNCTVQGRNPQPVTIVSGVAAEIAFTISCPSAGLTRWTRMTSGTTNELIDISGSSATNIFVVDNTGAVRHYDGTSWSQQPTPIGVSRVWANSSADAFATGVSAVGMSSILHYNGQHWSEAFSPPIPEGLQGHLFVWKGMWGTGNDVFAIGEWRRSAEDEHAPPGYLVHYDGTAWTSELWEWPSEGGVLSDIWGSSREDLYIVGSRYEGDPVGFVARRNGVGWSEIVARGPADFHHIWGSSASDIYVTYSEYWRGAESLYHFDGAGWEGTDAARSQPTGPMWGSSADDVYLLGSGSIHHFGNGWRIVFASQFGLRDIWGSSSTDVYVVGSGGVILHGTP